MTPQLVHRYAFPVREAIEALLGDAVGDCEAWHIRVEGDKVVIDVVAPAAPSIAPTVEDVASLTSNETAKSYMAASLPDAAIERDLGKSREEPHKHRPDVEPDFPADEQSGETSPEPELKGGRLARQAAMRCSERGFWTFLGVSDAEAAKADVCRRCGVTSRRFLDHDKRAETVWLNITTKYGLWLDGYDVELD